MTMRASSRSLAADHPLNGVSPPRPKTKSPPLCFGTAASSSIATAGNASTSARPFFVRVPGIVSTPASISLHLSAPISSRRQPVNSRSLMTRPAASSPQAFQMMRISSSDRTLSRGSMPAAGSLVAMTGLASHSPSRIAQQYIADKLPRALAAAVRPCALISSCSRAATSARMMASSGRSCSGLQYTPKYRVAALKVFGRKRSRLASR